LLGSIQGAAVAIGLITLVGAAIGLMNIMLVAVNERTKEVGLIKAIGGKRKIYGNSFCLSPPSSVCLALHLVFFQGYW